MALKVGDRVKQTSTTTGTGTITLNGAAPTGFSSFRDYLSDGDTTYYVIEDGTNYEIGLGTFNTGGSAIADTIARSSDANVYRSTNSNNRINWSSGTRSVFISLPSDKAVFKDASGTTKVASFETSATSILGDDVLLMSGSGYHLLWDSSESALDFADTSEIRMGATDDLVIYHNGTNSYIDNNDGILYITQKTNDSDIILSSDDGSGGTTAYVTLDGSEGEVLLNHYNSTKLTTKSTGVDVTGTVTATTFSGGLASDNLTVGDSAVTLSTTSGNITIDADGNDTDIIFKGTDGGLGRTYLTIDGSDAGTAQFSHDIRLYDEGKVMLGHNNDLQMGHFISYSALNNYTNDLVITNYANDKDISIHTDNGSGSTITYFRADGSTGESLLYYYGSSKLATKSSGVEVTGTLSATQISGNVYLGTSNTLIFEGSTADTRETTLTVEDPTSDRTITLPNDSGTVMLQGKDITTDLRIDSGKFLKLESTSTANKYISLGADATTYDRTILFPADSGTVMLVGKDITTDLKLDAGKTLKFESTSYANRYTTIGADATTYDRTINFPADSGTVMLQGKEINTDIKLGGGFSLKFESSYVPNKYTTLTGNASSYDHTITIPDDSGIMITTGNSNSPTTTTNSSDADHVLINDNGTMKKITPSDLGIGGGGGSGVTVQNQGSTLSTTATTLNFTGAGVVASGTGANKSITISGGAGITIQEEGSSLSTVATTLNFTGSAVTASGTGSTKTINITGGGSGGGMPTTGGTFTGDVTFSGDNVNMVWDKSENALAFADSAKAVFGSSGDFEILHIGNNANTTLKNYTNNLAILNYANDKDVDIYSDNGSGGTAVYFRADGSTGETLLYHYGSQKLATKSTGIQINGVSGGTAGTITLNCPENSHGVKIQSPAHSAAQSYTLILPDNQIAVNKILKVKSITGSGATAVGQLEFADESGGGGGGFMPTTGGTFTGDVTFNGSSYNALWDTSANSFYINDDAFLRIGTANGLVVYHSSGTGEKTQMNNNSGHFFIRQQDADKDIYIQSDDGSGGDATYFQADGGTGEALLFHYGATRLATKSGGVEVTGALTASGNITAYSDERLKSNIKTIDNALDKVTKLRGVSYTKEDTQGIGVIAQEVEKIIPEVVHDGEYKSVAYGNMVGVLIEAIKEQQKQIDKQQNQIDELKKLIG